MSEPLSFSKDSRPLFTALEVAHMQADMDLSDRDDVERHGAAILRAVTGGTMPPPNAGEARWTAEMCATFKRWQDEGCAP